MLPYGKLPDGREVMQFTLEGDNGLRVQLINFGSITTAIHVPDRDGNLDNVVLGCADLGAYLKGHPCLGTINGRYANRIAGPAFEIEGTKYPLTPNMTWTTQPMHLHGGVEGFDKKLWEAECVQLDGEHAVRMRYVSADGEEGYPGELTVSVTYTIKGSSLRMCYEATTDKPTHLNLTDHSYFNLKGSGKGRIDDHVMQIRANAFAEADIDGCATGVLLPVADTPFDFRQARPLSEVLDAEHPQIHVAKGIDHSFQIDTSAPAMSTIAEAWEPTSGRTLQVATTEPAIHLYTGNMLNGTCVGRQGIPYSSREGFCLETQHFANSPNLPQFPSTLLRPGDTFRSVTEYRFGVR